jgi:hypothetical protein
LGAGLLAAIGCGGGSQSSEFDGGDPGSGPGGNVPSLGGGDGGTSLGGGNDGGTNTTPSNGCTGEATNFVYVLSDANDLYKFDPPGKKFTLIGHLGCATSMMPNSMAVDRNAEAYVNYVDPGQGGDQAGALYKVSTTDASCTGPSVNLSKGWYRVGMGYSTDSAGSPNETLFVTGTNGQAQGNNNNPGLGQIDFGGKGIAPIGGFGGSLQGENAELTGTGDGRLFGFFTSTPIVVAQIDKSTGKVTSQQSLPHVEKPSFWAFSFWGGKFYLYTCPDALLDPSRTTNVTEYDQQTNAVNTSYMVDIGFRIVGAGVSTCAPVTPPK